MFQACREYVERKGGPGVTIDVDQIITDLVEPPAQKEAQEAPAGKITTKEIEDLYSKIPDKEFELDADIPNLNEMSKR